MRKKILAVTVLLLVLCGISSLNTTEVKAASEEVYDHSQLTEELESRADMLVRSRGMYLQSGGTVVSKLGIGKLGAGGDTVAQRVVDTIKVAVIVEQWREDGQYWSQVASWEESAKNTYYINSERTYTVPRGYYYRVRGIHSANSDGGNSYTNGIWFG